MSAWKCGVCGYIHKEEQPPELCPVCSAAREVFSQQQVEPGAAAEGKKGPGQEEGGKSWRCTVSGYIHQGLEPPEKCPVCEATAEQFEEVIAGAEAAAKKDRRWRCTVCGYIHSGDEPPEKCPVCAAPATAFVEIDASGKILSEDGPKEMESLGLQTKEEVAASAEKTEKAKKEGETEDKVEKGPRTLLDTLAALVLRFHLHPITVHFPNGIIPAAVLFLGLAILFNLPIFEPIAFFNFAFVLVMLPVVLFTGYLEWQRRYMGARTLVFITKIICSIIVLGAVNILVFWRLIDSSVALEGSSSRLIYLAVAGLALGAAGIAGHLGGKLVFGARGN